MGFEFDPAMFSGVVRVFLNGFSIVSVGGISLLWVTGCLSKVMRFFFGDMEEGEIEKFSMLALCFGVIIGSYWMMRSIKDAVFFELVGGSHVPKAKIITPIVTFSILAIYGKLVDQFKRLQLFWIMCVFYAALFFATGILWKMNFPVVDSPLVNWIPGRFLGWLYYIGVESFGGVIIGAVFLAFVHSTTKTESAKKGFPLIFVGAQIGNFLGPAVTAGYAEIIGNSTLIFIPAIMILLIPVIMEVYMKVIPAHLHESEDSGHKKKKSGALEGLRLILSKPFLVGVLVVSTVYEVVGTIIDYQFKILGSQFYSKEYFTIFNSFFAMSQALVALVFTIVGTGYLIRKLGIRKCLLGYPILMAITVVCLWFKPALGSFFVAMIIVKAASYALNSPVKEFLYLPTSKDVKYKAKGFIDGFGGKTAKAGGSLVTNALAGNVPLLLSAGGLISLGIIGFWAVVAMALGAKYDKLIENKEIIE